MWPEYADPLGVKPQHLQKLSKFFKDAEEATFVEVSHWFRWLLCRCCSELQARQLPRTPPQPS